MNNQEIRKILKKSSDIIVRKLEKHGLVSLYKTGTILTKDQTHDSDIDFALIVEPNFDFQLIDKLNSCLNDQHKIKIGAFAFSLCEISGQYKENPNNPLTGLRLTYRIFKALCYQGEWIWGKKLPLKKFLKEFSPQNPTYFTPLAEAKNQITYIRKEVEQIRDHHYANYRKIPKYCLVLIRCEAILEHNFKYSPWYFDLHRHMKHLEGHIIHECMRARKDPKFCQQDCLKLCGAIEEYISECETKIHNGTWK